jgi:hypothetical protein
MAFLATLIKLCDVSHAEDLSSISVEADDIGE